MTRPGRGQRVTALVVAAAATWLLLAWAAPRGLVVSAELPRADAIVMLGGGAAYAERARRAAALFQEGRAPVILVTNDGGLGGWSFPDQRNLYFVEKATRELGRAGVARERIEVLPGVVNTTYDEARLLRQYASTRGLRSLLVVTSAYHSRRALWTLLRVFEDSGIQIGLAPAPLTPQAPLSATWWLSGAGWNMVGGEYLKTVYYVLRY